MAQRPIVLTLGCSFTYGAACIAEDTYPEQLAQRISGTALNAGVCSYGVAGMVLVAEAVIPEYKPDLVVVQYSPWLVDRSKGIYLPSYYGKLPGPYFAEMNDGNLEIQPPVFPRFNTRIFSYRGSPKGFMEFWQFAFTDGVLWKCYDDFRALYTYLSLATGRTVAPFQEDDQIFSYAYNRIHSACEKAGAEMLIVVVSNWENRDYSMPQSLLTFGVPIVRADQALLDNLTERTGRAYRESYGHWRGDPPRLVDGHPNPLAHSLIAKSIHEQLGSWLKTFADAHDFVPTSKAEN